MKFNYDFMSEQRPEYKSSKAFEKLIDEYIDEAERKEYFKNVIIEKNICKTVNKGETIVNSFRFNQISYHTWN
jgi:hypothetical protein